MKDNLILGLTLAQTVGLICLLLMTSCSYINHSLGLEDDNLAEEILEAAIKIEAGISVDLTPGSPE